MESAKRASVGNNCVESEFFFFFLKRGSKGERGATPNFGQLFSGVGRKSAIQKKVKRIFHFSFTRDRRPIYDAHFALSNTHTHTHALRE